MRKQNKYLAFFLAMLLMFAFTACKAKTDATADNAQTPTGAVTEQAATAVPSATETPDNTEDTTPKQATNTEATSYPVTIQDTNGDEIVFDHEPTKVVSMGPNITEMLYAIGVGDRLVGRTDYCDFPEEALSVESIGTLETPNVEKIVSLNPDVVIGSTHFSEDTEKQLTDLGIKVVVLYEEKDVTGVYTILETLGTIFSVDGNAKTVVEDMKTTIDETVAAVKDLEAPSVYYVVGYGEYGDYTAGGDTFAGQLITLAGGNNIAKDVSGWSYSLESLLEADPEIIILPEYYYTNFINAEHYKDLGAVKNNKVFVVDQNLLERQGNRNAEGIRALAEIFHADAFR